MHETLDALAARPARHAIVTISRTRLRILLYLADRPRTLGEIARHLDINKSAVHKHLQRLVQEEYLARAPSRKWVYYSLRENARAFLRAGLAALDAASGPPGAWAAAYAGAGAGPV